MLYSDDDNKDWPGFYLVSGLAVALRGVFVSVVAVAMCIREFRGGASEGTLKGGVDLD